MTCNLALVRLLSTIKETRSATPCPNSAVSTPAATFNVVDETSVDALEEPEDINCATPAVPSFEVPDKEESVLPPCACLSAAPALAEAEIVCAKDAAVAAVTAVLEADACAADAAIATAGEALGPPTPGGAAPVSGAAKPSAMNEGSEGALVPCVMAAAMSICAAAAVSAEAGPPSGVVLRAAVLPSVDVGAGAAAAITALPAVPSTGLAVSAEFPAVAPTRAGGVAAPAAPCAGAIAAGGIEGPAAASG